MQQLLPFSIGDATYALELAEVQEVVEDKTIYPFPGTTTTIAGAISFHGRIIIVIELAQLLSFSNSKIGNRLIVLTNQEQQFALGVERVGKIINIDPEKSKRMESTDDKNYITEIIQHSGKVINLFNLEQLKLQLKELCTGGENV